MLNVVLKWSVVMNTNEKGNDNDVHKLRLFHVIVEN